MMPRNSSRMVNYVSIPVPMSVPFPAAVGGGGYRGRRRESRGGERSRDIYPRVDQRDSYRRRSNERVSSRRGSRKPFLDRITVNHERYSSRGGDDRRQRRSKGGNVKSSSHKKVGVVYAASMVFTASLSADVSESDGHGAGYLYARDASSPNRLKSRALPLMMVMN